MPFPIIVRCLAPLLLVAAGALVANAYAAEPRPPLEEFVAQVLAANPGLEAMAAAVEAAEHRIAPAGALDDPRASFGTAPRTLDNRPRSQWSLSQTLPWPGKRPLRGEVARFDAEAVRAEEQALRLELAAAARALYAEWTYVHAALAINAEHQALLAELIEQTHSLLAADLARRQDVVQAETQAARLRTAALRLEQARREIAARMNALRGQSAELDVAPPHELPATHPAPPLSTLIARARDAHPELVALRMRASRADARVALAEREFLPDFTVSGSYDNLMAMSDRHWRVGVAINIPLDLGGKRRAAVDAAGADRRRLSRELDAQILRIESELVIVHGRMEEAHERTALLDTELVPLAEQNLEAALDAYAAGDGRFLEILDAQRQRLTLQAELARAQADYFQALAQLKRWSANGLSAPTAP